MKPVLMVVLSVLMCSCTNEIKRQAHILPIYDGMLLSSADPKFISSSEDVGYLAPEIKRHPKASFARLEDGSFLVTWISTQQRREKLMFIDSGMHPVEVPNKAIKETSNIDEDIPIGEPFVLTDFGPNTGYVRDFLDLRPISKTSPSGSEVRSTRHVRGGARR